MRVSQGIGVLVRTSATAGYSFSFHIFNAKQTRSQKSQLTIWRFQMEKESKF
jgi:hypothetical protein